MSLRRGNLVLDVYLRLPHHLGLGTPLCGTRPAMARDDIKIIYYCVLSARCAVSFRGCQLATARLATINAPPASNCQLNCSCRNTTPRITPPNGNKYVTIVVRVGPISWIR